MSSNIKRQILLAFHEAYENRNLKEFKTCLELLSDDDLAITDKFGRTALHRVCMNNESLYIKLLLERSSSSDVTTPDKKGLTPLHYVCKHGTLGICRAVERMLTKFSTNEYSCLMTADDEGMTPLHYACIVGDFNAVCIFTNALDNAAITARDKHNRSAFHYASISKTGHGKDLIICSLFKHIHDDVCVTEPDEDGLTPIHYMCRSGTLSILHRTLEKFPNIPSSVFTAQDNNGMTPLHWVCKTGDYDTYMELIGMLPMVDNDINAFHIRDAENKLPLHHVLTQKSSDFVYHVISHTTYEGIVWADVYGLTPLHHAFLHSNMSAAFILCGKLTAEDRNCTDISGRTPYCLLKSSDKNDPTTKLMTRMYFNTRADHNI